MTSPPRNEPAITDVVVDHHGSAVVLRIRGDVDSATAPDLHTTITGKLGPTTGPVVLDLSGVAFLSSAGLRLLLEVRNVLTADGRTLRLVTGSVRAVVRPVEITGLDREFDLYPDLPSALGG